MLIQIPGLLDKQQTDEIRAALDNANWVDGNATAGSMAVRVKQNRQLAESDPLGKELGEKIVRALHRSQLFVAAALPKKILPPLFNCYESAESYGRHIDGAIRPIAGTPHRIRTDLSATLFLSEPDSYEGGELQIEDPSGPRRVKLAAGDLLLYSATSVHGVRPVTSGKRLAGFFWIESMVREDHKRAILFQLDRATQKVTSHEKGDGAEIELAGVYHNLLRLWADV